LLKFLSANIPGNILPNLEQQWSYDVLPSGLVVPSASTLSHMCRREYSLSLNAITKQFPSRNNDSLPVASWTSMNKLTKTSVITYSMYWNETLQEVQLGFHEVQSLFCSYFKTSAKTKFPSINLFSLVYRTLKNMKSRFSWNIALR
jgi:hypothetical protein